MPTKSKGAFLTITLEYPTQFRIENRKAWSVVLEPIHGERGRFHAHSLTRFRCPTCHATYTRKTCDPTCKRCHAPGEPVTYLVDVIEKVCSCEAFTTSLGVACKHCHAALYLFGHFKAVEAAEAERKRKIAAEQARHATY